MNQKSVFTFLTLILCSFVFAQSTGDVKSVQAPSKKLEQAIESRDESKAAEAYMNLGDSYFNQNNFAKSEDYYQKSKMIYAKINDEKKLVIVTRKLAQAQERQSKVSAAARSYEAASNASPSGYEKSVNSNDASRLKSSSMVSKEKAVQENMRVNSAYQKKEELSKDYENMAEINVQQNDLPAATKNLENAYELSKEKEPEKALEINQKTVDLLVEQKQFDKAIEKKKEVLEEDFVKQNSQEKVNQIQELAEIYLKNNDGEKARELLQNSYKLALENNHTIEARKSLIKLDSLNLAEGKPEQSIILYKDFLSKLPSMLEKDSSLLNGKLIKETEDRIAQLEKEKNLQDELIKRTSLFNYLLIGGLLLALGFIGFALYAQKKLKRQNKKIELQSLRREMNPHFIFNSLNSVNQFIAENNELEANQYLTKFSKLMRGVMENSKDDFIPFNEELDLLKNYLALEKSRFHDKFDYEITVDPQLNGNDLKIPGMLIQPFLENAIWHGLRYKAEKGLLKLEFSKENNLFKVKIDDNGIGMKQSEAQKTVHQKQRNGRGMKNTLERISLLNDLYGKEIECSAKDKSGETGTVVNLKMKI